MALNVISNFAANVAHRHLTMSDKDATESVAKLSSGQRVLSAKDDAAAMAIGSRLSADVAGLDQAGINAGQAVSMLQIADGGMARVQDILVRMKTLSVQASSGQLSDNQRGQLDIEYQALIGEIDRIADDTTFSGTKLIDGTFSGINFKVGTGTVPGEDNIQISISGVEAADLMTSFVGYSYTLKKAERWNEP
jgi:flagellin